MAKTGPKPIDVAIRFLAKVGAPDERGCWPWAGSKDRRGYGSFYCLGAGKKAHRFAYLTHNGPIPPGAVIRHTCDNTACVNPAHLITGTQQENIQDACLRDRFPSGAAHRCAVLTEADVRYIRSKPRTRGMGVTLAHRFRVAPTTVYDIIRGRTWRHVA